MFVYVKWNRSGNVFSSRDCRFEPSLVGVLQWPLPERRPATPEAERLGRSGGRDQRCR